MLSLLHVLVCSTADGKDVPGAQDAHGSQHSTRVGATPTTLWVVALQLTVEASPEVVLDTSQPCSCRKCHTSCMGSQTQGCYLCRSVCVCVCVCVCIQNIDNTTGSERALWHVCISMSRDVVWSHTYVDDAILKSPFDVLNQGSLV